MGLEIIGRRKGKMRVTENRESNFELLRIISMLLIVMGHCFGTIGVSESLGINRFMSIVFGAFSHVGVNCFIAISAYFFLLRKIFKISKLFELIVQFLAYVFLFVMVAICVESTRSENSIWSVVAGCT